MSAKYTVYCTRDGHWTYFDTFPNRFKAEVACRVLGRAGYMAEISGPDTPVEHDEYD